MTIKKSIFLFILSSVIFFQCNDEPTSIGSDIINQLNNDINLVTINSSEDTLLQKFSSFHPEEVKLATADRILLGRTDSINASVLIKFGVTLPDSIKNDVLNNNITVTSAVMELIQVYRFGEESAEFDFTVHKVNSGWSVNFTQDSLSSLNVEPGDISEGDPEVDDSITTVALSNQVIMDWLEDAADTAVSNNNGIYLKPTEGTRKVLGYQAININLANIPVVKVVISKPGAYIDTLTLSSTLDVGVMQGGIPASPENIIIRAGFVINSKLFFDLSTLPENIIVSKAELVLTVDTLETKLGTAPANALQTFFLFDSTNTDSISASSITLRRSGNTFSGIITSFVRSWLNNNNNQGMLITAANPLNGVELYAIKGSGTADKPLLRITYAKIN